MAAIEQTRFATRDPGQAGALIRAAYDSRLRINGSTDDFRFEHSRYDVGSVRLDTFYSTLTTEYETPPLGGLQILRMVRGTLEWTTGPDRRIGPGQVILTAQPDEPNASRLREGRIQVVGMDISLLADVSGEPSLPAARRLRADVLPPGLAAFWQQAVHFATVTVSGLPEVAAYPLVLDATRRLLATAALTAFDPRNDRDDRSDSTDALPTTLRRAVAYIEANPDLEIGLADIARAAHVTPRAIQLAFRKYRDTTPLGYLRRVRLDRAHADLRAASPEDGVTVTAVALRWGFTRPSRFAADYRHAYGQSPGTTLRT